jgi:hypothetical protein
MNYTILNPTTGKQVSIYGKIGQKLIFNYIQSGGGNCSLCGAENTSSTSCPLNNQAINGGDVTKHLPIRTSLIQYGFSIKQIDEALKRKGTIEGAIQWILSSEGMKIAPAEPVVVKRTIPQTWACPTCTLRNPISNLICDMCGEYKPGNEPPLKKVDELDEIELECNSRTEYGPNKCCGECKGNITEKCMWSLKSGCIKRLKKKELIYNSQIDDNWYKKYHIPEFTKDMTSMDNIIGILSNIPSQLELLQQYHEQWWLNKPLGYFAIFSHGSYQILEPIDAVDFVVPDGIRIVMFEKTGKGVHFSIDSMLSDPEFMDNSCVQWLLDRSITPAYLFSYQGYLGERINFDICQVCTMQLKPCKMCQILQQFKRKSPNCSFSIYDSGSVCANLGIIWDSKIGSESSKLTLTKLGIYKLPNNELSLYSDDIPSDSSKEKLYSKYPKWEEENAFRGSFMPMDISVYSTLGIIKTTDKILEENRQHKSTAAMMKGYDHEIPRILPDRIETDPSIIWDKYGNKNSTLHHIIYNVPRGTVEHPMVYFVDACRTAFPSQLPLLRQYSEYQAKPILDRVLTQVRK